MSYTYDYLSPYDLLDCYLLHGLLTPVFDDVEGLGKWRGEGENIKCAKYKCMKYTKYTKYIASLIPTLMAFMPAHCVVTPTVVKLVLESRSSVLHLGVLAHLCWWDKLPPYKQQCLIDLVNEYQKTSELSYYKLVDGIELARANKVPSKLRSRPDIGYKHRKVEQGMG